MHFSPFANGLSGHETKRYLLNSASPLYRAYVNWFDAAWERSVDARRESTWLLKSLGINKAVFVDRDDTLIRDICYFGSAELAPIEILPGVIDGLKVLLDKGFRVIVVSNQQSVGLKVNDEFQLAKLTERIKGNFAQHGIGFDAFYYCKHTIRDDCNCRKPASGLIDQAVVDFGLDVRNCYMVGDSDADAALASSVPGLRVYRVTRERSFLEVVRIICAAGDGVSLS
jgi:D-glycero-D-manno-heptose 1,7-bisphosphate phosphatase